MQSETLLLTDLFENVHNKYIEIYELNRLIFFLRQDWHGSHA